MTRFSQKIFIIWQIVLLLYVSAISSDCIWTNGGGNNLWSNASNWSDGVPGSGDTAVFDGNTGNGNCTLDGSVTISHIKGQNSYSGTLSMGTNTLTVTDDADFSGIATDRGTGKLKMTGTGATLTAHADHYFNDLEITGTVTLAGDHTPIGDVLTVGSGATLTLNKDLYMRTGSTTSLTGTIDGSGELLVREGTLGSGGTINCPVEFRAQSHTIPVRTYGGAVQLHSTQVSGAVTFTFSSGTYNFNDGLTVLLDDAADYALTVDATTNDPTVNITGDLTVSSETSTLIDLDMGSGTWTVSGNVSLDNTSADNLTTESETSGKLKMTGNGKTLFHDGINWQSRFWDLEVTNSVTITGAASQVRVKNNLILGAGATVTIDESDDFLMMPNTGHVNLASDAEINGGGVLRVQGISTFTTTGTVSCDVSFRRYDTTIPARAWDGAAEIYNAHSSSHTFTFASGNHTFNNGLEFQLDTDGGGLVVDGANNNPTVNISGDFTTVDNSANDISLSMGSDTWTVTDGSVDLSSVVNLTATNATLALNNGNLEKLLKNGKCLLDRH